VSQNVLYEEAGELKVGAVLAEHQSSLQVEAPHGKRSKVKASAVLLRFEHAGLARFMEQAQQLAAQLDVDFLWQCCGPEEFSFEALAREYFGREPTPVESAALLVRLHGAPMYFYKKGRGRYKPAPPDALKAALASIERKRREAEKRERYVAQLMQFRLPEEFRPLLDRLLYQPDKTGTEWKALEAACAALKLSPARLIEKCGALGCEHDYHLNRFLFEHFPRGAGFPDLAPPEVPEDLPLAAAPAFSIDDTTTTEIDDAFSVASEPDGRWRVGIHIAAPALGIPASSALDAVARDRLSTVYFPGGKITMLPEAAIRVFSLAAGGARPALSLYVEVTPGGAIASHTTRIERVAIAANLRLAALEEVFNEETLAAGRIEHPYAAPLVQLWQLARALARARGVEQPEAEARPEWSFYVEEGRVRIVPRRRGTPVDRIVSELMIYANSTWGQQLAQAGVAALYRVQDAGKVRMSTVPGGHEGLGVQSYAWASSPLRRYVDLVNQRQLLALARGTPPPYGANDERLLAALRDFESAYEAYAEFQRRMERYWCLRWLLQENVQYAPAVVLREASARFEMLPLAVRVPSLPALEPGVRVELAIEKVDLLELELRCVYRRRLAPAEPLAATG
jgi:exoribonuclease-2